MQSDRVQLSGKRARGGAEGSHCRADLFLGLQGSRGEESPTILKLRKPNPYILSYLYISKVRAGLRTDQLAKDR